MICRAIDPETLMFCTLPDGHHLETDHMATMEENDFNGLDCVCFECTDVYIEENNISILRQWPVGRRLDSERMSPILPPKPDRRTKMAERLP